MKKLFLCPKCYTLSFILEEIDLKTTSYYLSPYGEVLDEFEGDDEDTRYRCLECESILDGESFEDFVVCVEVQDQQITNIEPDGQYWINHKDDLDRNRDRIKLPRSL